MTFESTPPPTIAKISKPRKIELPNENPDIENITTTIAPKLPAGVANLWHAHKYHPTTYAMVIPTGDDGCRFVIRIQVGGAGTAMALEGADMNVSEALKILNEYYIQSRLMKQAF